MQILHIMDEPHVSSSRSSGNYLTCLFSTLIMSTQSYYVHVYFKHPRKYRNCIYISIRSSPSTTLSMTFSNPLSLHLCLDKTYHLQGTHLCTILNF